MGVQADIASRTSALQAVLDAANAAITAKGGHAAGTLTSLAGAITALPTGGSGSGAVQIKDHTVSSTDPIQVPFTGGAGPIEVWGWGQLGIGWQASMYLFLGHEYATYIGETPANAMDVTIDGNGVINGLPKIDAGKLLIVRR